MMKTRAPWVLMILAGLSASLIAAEPPAKPAPDSAKAPPAAADAKQPAEKTAALPPALAESQAIEEAKRAHILPPTDPFKIDTPPPAPRVETKPPSPAAGTVWIPGHWRPVKGAWQWTPGEWGVPATAASVWIEPRYDPKMKVWSPGYWQPDRAQSYEPDVLEKEPTSPGTR
jgi:hypothetical protein